MVSSQQHLAILGGGISGLSAAYEAMKRGQDPHSIAIYEASNRVGGHIKSGTIAANDPKFVNEGAEFIDSEHKHLIAMCEEFGVPLVENKGMETEFFQRLNGEKMDGDTFYKLYKPYAEQIIRDRQEMAANPNGARANLIRNASLQAYFDDLTQRVKPAERSVWQWIKDTVTLHHNESLDTLAMAGNAYASEAGQPVHNISAAQFVAEASPDTETFLASDCKYRVEGGTEKLIQALQAKLSEQGVRFHTGHAIDSIAKRSDGQTELGFTTPGQNVACGKVISALPTYALAKVKGLGALGLSPESIDLINNCQYTKSIKCTVAFKPGMAMPEAAFYAKGYQTWSPAPGYLTFLANADELGSTQTPKQFLTGLMESYAQANGTTAAKLFDVQKLNFTNPGNAPCYASPKADQIAAFEKLKADLPVLAKNGVGITGTFLPHHGSFGFMECGLESAKRSCDLLIGQEKSAGIEHQRTHVKQWTPHIEARRAQAANDAQYNVVAGGR